MIRKLFAMVEQREGKIVPFNELRAKFTVSNFLRLENEEGISPVNELVLRSKENSCVSIEREDGNDPVKRL